MIVTNEFINKLKDFGLNSYEVKLWVALLSRGTSTAGELSDIANVPRSRTYDVLESLEKKGFIIMKIGKPIKYLAIEPERVVDVIKKQIQIEADEKAASMEKVKDSDVLKELQLLHTQGIDHVDSTELSGSLKGRQNVHSHLEATIASASESVVIMTTTTGLETFAEHFLPILQKVAKRGVTIRIAAPLNESVMDSVKLLDGIAEVKDTNTTGRFVLVDSSELMFMIMDDSAVHPTYDVGIWVNTPFFTQALENLFELAWKEMKSVKVKR